jgi:uncharacterized protein (DUF2384 family)
VGMRGTTYPNPWAAALLAFPMTWIAPAPPATASAFLVGTGGMENASYYSARGDRGYSKVKFVNLNEKQIEFPQTPIDHLEKILEVLRPSITTLARTIGVSRQSIYDWQSGTHISPENSAKLSNLAKAADVFAAEKLEATQQLLQRKISGASFLDRVNRGESAVEAARLLLSVCKRESDQRRSINARLHGRKKITDLDEDFGSPHLSEQG